MKLMSFPAWQCLRITARIQILLCIEVVEKCQFISIHGFLMLSGHLKVKKRRPWWEMISKKCCMWIKLSKKHKYFLKKKIWWITFQKYLDTNVLSWVNYFISLWLVGMIDKEYLWLDLLKLFIHFLIMRIDYIITKLLLIWWTWIVITYWILWIYCIYNKIFHLKLQ